MAMTSSRPYLIRALYEWIVDNQCTPYILVNAMAEGVLVPSNCINPDGQIVLNVSPSAVSDLVMDDAGLSFSARFGGIASDISVPSAAIMGVYAKENQRGMIFDHSGPEFSPEDPPPVNRGPRNNDKTKNGRRKPQKGPPPLKVVK